MRNYSDIFPRVRHAGGSVSDKMEFVGFAALNLLFCRVNLIQRKTFFGSFGDLCQLNTCFCKLTIPRVV